MDALPTLIVPDDPETGTIERPVTPKPPEPVPNDTDGDTQPLSSKTSARVYPKDVVEKKEERQDVSSRDYKTMAKRANVLANRDRLAGGKKSVFDIKMSDIAALGIGMQLYFMLIKYLSITFLVMGIISLPAIVVNYYGHGVTSNLVDPLELAFASLGNQGVNPEIAANPANCLPIGEIDCTGKTVRTPFTSDPETVTWIITTCDLLYSFIFLLFVVVYHVQAKKAISKHLLENLTPAKYAIFVRGLPRDATEREVMEHFSNLYDLTKEETFRPLWFNVCWGKRRKVKNSLSEEAINRSPVSNVEHLACFSGDKKNMYIDSWVAEVSIGHPTGGLLRTFLAMEILTKKITETKQLKKILEYEKEEASKETNEKMKKKKFRPKDERLLARTIKKLQALDEKLDQKTSKIKALKEPNAVAAPQDDAINKLEKKNSANFKPNLSLKKLPLPQADKTDPNAFDWSACECAFVTFNNLESRRRCLNDYRKSAMYLPRKWQPTELRFRQKHPLIVRPAPEPSNILWENLETTDKERLKRRSITTCVTLLLLFGSVAVISGAQSAQQEFKSKMPPSGLCGYKLPELFYGSTDFEEDSNTWELVWDSNATCPVDSVSNMPAYNITYANGIVNPINHTAPIQDPSNPPVRCTEPCITETSSRICSTLPCFDQNLLDDGDKCETYLESHILYCFCMDALTESIEEYGLKEGAEILWNDYIPCQGFITNYITKNALIVAAACVVVVVNLLLKTILRGFASFERHSSESSKASAISLKMFSAQFLNTAVIVLVVNASLGVDSIPVLKDLFKGEFIDFERNWYPLVGMGITMTMLINAFAPQAAPFLQMLVLFPLKRCWQKRSVRTQEAMNELYAGPQFNIAERYPVILNCVFVTMMFCGGSPVLLFIASLTCGLTYWLDKLSVIHLYSIRTAYDEALGETILGLLPWTLLLHLSFSMWMYGNPDLLQSSKLNLNGLLSTFSIESNTTTNATVYDQFLTEAAKVDMLGDSGLVAKLVRSNSALVAVCVALLLAGIFLTAIWRSVLLPVYNRTIGVVVAKALTRLRTCTQACGRVLWKVLKKCCCCRRKKASGEVVPINADGTSLSESANQEKRDVDSQDSNTRNDSGDASGMLKKKRVVLPEFTDIFRKSIPKKYKPDKRLGYELNEDGDLVRNYVEETALPGGLRRWIGTPMRTWEALPAPVKIYAIEANSKYAVAVSQLLETSEKKALTARSTARDTARQEALKKDEETKKQADGEIVNAVDMTEGKPLNDSANNAVNEEK